MKRLIQVRHRQEKADVLPANHSKSDQLSVHEIFKVFVEFVGLTLGRRVKAPVSLPRCVIKEWMFFAGAIRAQDCLSIRKITVASVAPFTVIAPINRYANEATLGE